MGLDVWLHATHSLCHILHKFPDLVRNRRVLELGCGAGLGGMYSLACGARQVTFTDWDQGALEQCEGNVVLNVDEGVLDPSASAWRFRRLQWGRCDVDTSRRNLLDSEIEPSESDADKTGEPDEAVEFESLAEAEIVLGCDVCYETAHAELLADTVRTRCTGARTVVFSVPVRGDNPESMLVSLSLHPSPAETRSCFWPSVDTLHQNLLGCMKEAGWKVNGDQCGFDRYPVSVLDLLSEKEDTFFDVYVYVFERETSVRR